MKHNEFYVQYIEEFSRLILCSVFPNYFLCHNVSNKSPDLIDVRNKLGFEVTLGIIPNVALKYLKANSPTYFFEVKKYEIYKEVYNFAVMNFGKNMTSLEKDTAYNKLSQEAKTYIAIINDNGDKLYSTYNFANKKYLVYSIFGKFLKLNSKNSSYWASNNITNLFVLETDFQYEIDDIEEIKKELEKMVSKEKFSRFFNKIYIYGTCKIFEFELNKSAINEIRISEEIVSKAIINAKANTNYDIELK